MTSSVLIVDDDETFRVMALATLNRYGIEAVAVDGATACLGQLRAGFRGVILMDIQMPEHDGWDTIRLIRDGDLLGANIVLMLTGEETPDEKMDDLQEYVFGYLTKPFDPQDLASTVKTYLRKFDDGSTS